MPENLVPVDATTPQKLLSFLLQAGHSDLTEAEEQRMSIYMQAESVLGVAASAPMRCAGESCPIAVTCPLQQMHKAPLGQPCPIETEYAIDKFVDWTKEIEVSIADLKATTRSSIAQLVVIDVQERRCLKIMSEGKAASMTDLAVKEVDLQTGEALSFERIVHANQQILQELRTARRMILDDMERSEKAKTRKLKTLQGKTGKDLATRQSANADAIRDVIDIPYESVATK